MTTHWRERIPGKGCQQSGEAQGGYQHLVVIDVITTSRIPRKTHTSQRRSKPPRCYMFSFYRNILDRRDISYVHPSMLPQVMLVKGKEDTFALCLFSVHPGYM